MTLEKQQKQHHEKHSSLESVLNNTGGVLNGKTVLVTRPQEQAQEFVTLLRSYGADVVVAPMIQIVEPETWIECDDVIENHTQYNAILFTSANAVDFFCRRVTQIQHSLERYSEVPLFVVGTKTQETVAKFDLHSRVIADHFTGRDLAHALLKELPKGATVLFPHGSIGKYESVAILREGGINVKEIVVYKTIAPQVDEAIWKKHFDIITFFSPSSIKNLLTMISQNAIAQSTVAAIGTTTEQAAQEKGIPVHIVSPKATAKDLVSAIVSYYTQK